MLARSCIYGAIFFVFSLVIFPYYTEGDQFAYRGFYQGVVGLDFGEAFAFYRASLGSSEPVYFIIVYYLASFLPKDILFSIINGWFAFTLSRLLDRRGMKWYLGPLIFSNFYFLVLLFAAERLKIALLLFGLAYFFKGISRYIVILCAVLGHVQLIMLAASAQAARISVIVTSLLKGKISKETLALISLFLVLLAIFPALANHIYSKYEYYQIFGGLAELGKPIVFTLLACYYARRNIMEVVIANLPLMLAAYAIGADRVVIFSYFVFLYYALNYRGGLNAGVFATSAYFTVKGYLFIVAILMYGHGFPLLE